MRSDLGQSDARWTINFWGRPSPRPSAGTPRGAPHEPSTTGALVTITARVNGSRILDGSLVVRASCWTWPRRAICSTCRRARAQYASTRRSFVLHSRRCEHRRPAPGVDELVAALHSFRYSVFRLETLQVYADPVEANGIAAFRPG